MMTLAHFVYIPGILLLGVVIGWVLGARAADLARRDASERDEAARAREQARAARARARAGDPAVADAAAHASGGAPSPASQDAPQG